MKRISVLIVVVVVAIAAILVTQQAGRGDTQTPQATTTPAAVSVVAEELEIPWDIAFLPEGGMLVTERTGHLIAIAKDGAQTEIPIDGVARGGEGGLLGIVLHPEFARNHFLYLYMGVKSAANQTQNRVIRYTYEGGVLTQNKVIITGIPGAIYHDGGRMEFGPDSLLYITTGDATTPTLAQDKASLAGKILRLHDDGDVPVGNPFGTAVYSWGHRNPQGLAWDAADRLWESEHGPTGELSACCHDELNLIKPGSNYGWPTIIGDQTKVGLQAPAWQSGDGTWAPASLAYLKGSLYFGGLMGKALYRATLDGERVTGLETFYKNEYGRIRTVRVGPDDMLYLTTSNRDGRGDPVAGDDKIIRINPDLL